MTPPLPAGPHAAPPCFRPATFHAAPTDYGPEPSGFNVRDQHGEIFAYCRDRFAADLIARALTAYAAAFVKEAA